MLLPVLPALGAAAVTKIILASLVAAGVIAPAAFKLVGELVKEQNIKGLDKIGLSLLKMEQKRLKKGEITHEAFVSRVEEIVKSHGVKNKK
ncbi:MAG: hypothetical protein FWE37_08530 [Spirochaetaceae bacterium]|nr:hypothetical protein [Spirochaetaceae bacterium]